ncbi:MAG TPA: glycosyltransferase family 2 protein [Candidatus Binatia bacterium]|nr:glycosyltransferase family 2 protein [Candidatus Binatia bacterium]
MIVVNWNAGSVLGDCLRTVVRELQTVSGECLVVDNGSEGDDLAGLQRVFPQVSMVVNLQNLGFARAVNQGLSRSQGRYIMLLNPDAELTAGSLRHMIADLDAHPAIGIIGPRIMNVDGTIQGSARAFPGLCTAFFGRTSFLTRYFSRNPLSRRQVPALGARLEQPQPVDWVSGACMVIRRQAVEEVGGLDERFFLYWEDADLCWRLHKRGWQIIYDPQVCIIHSVGVSARQAPFRSLLAFHRSAYRLYRKHLVPSAWHPLSALAAVGLGLRAASLLLWVGVQAGWSQRAKLDDWVGRYLRRC